MLADEPRRTEHTGSFVSWCLERGVDCVIRMNLPTGYASHLLTYDAAVFKAAGIEHHDLPVDTHHGIVPSPSVVRTFLKTACAHMGIPLDCTHRSTAEHMGIVLLHCNSGFERGAVLACCLLIWCFDISGRSSLAWLRVARPGAVNSSEQEQFLSRFSSRKDLRRFIDGLASCVGCRTS